MLMLVDCSNCRAQLQLPPGAKTIRCALCHAVTRIADPRAVVPPPPPTYSTYHHHHPPPLPPPQTLSPYNYAPPGQPPSVNGQKRAVICGISYEGSRNELKGCLNDAKCMKFMLMNKFNFPESSIIMLTEEERDPTRLPTKHNIRMAMYWLVQGCRPGDSLVFHFSGHGSQQRNYNGDELDGYDETICPLDFEAQGMIVDDEINATIVKPLPHGVKLHAIIDACHSGTVLDLPYLCRMDRMGRYVWEDHRPQSGAWKGTNGGEVISFSGCDDDQTSADTSALSKVTSTGAMTFSFIQAIERGHGITYGDILTAMRSAIRKTDNNLGGGSTVVTSLLTMLLTGGIPGEGMRQEPQLTANEPFDVYKKVVGWRLSNEGGGNRLQCLWKLRDFKCGVELVNRIYKAIESTGHFPNLHLEQPNQVRAELWTSSIGGLSMNDFIVAAKIDEIQTSDLVPRKRVWA